MQVCLCKRVYVCMYVCMFAEPHSRWSTEKISPIEFYVNTRALSCAVLSMLSHLPFMVPALGIARVASPLLCLLLLCGMVLLSRKSLRRIDSFTVIMGLTEDVNTNRVPGMYLCLSACACMWG